MFARMFLNFMVMEEHKRMAAAQKALQAQEVKVAALLAKGAQVEQHRGELRREQEERKKEVGAWKAERAELQAGRRAAEEAQTAAG